MQQTKQEDVILWRDRPQPAVQLYQMSFLGSACLQQTAKMTNFQSCSTFWCSNVCIPSCGMVLYLILIYYRGQIR